MNKKYLEQYKLLYKIKPKYGASSVKFFDILYSMLEKEKDNIIYFGPMGCRTGFYLLMKGDLESKNVVELIKELLIFVKDFEGEIPGASPRDCGNCEDMDLNLAKYEATKYLEEVILNIGEENLNYPK